MKTAQSFENETECEGDGLLSYGVYVLSETLSRFILHPDDKPSLSDLFIFTIHSHRHVSHRLVLCSSLF